MGVGRGGEDWGSLRPRKCRGPPRGWAVLRHRRLSWLHLRRALSQVRGTWDPPQSEREKKPENEVESVRLGALGTHSGPGEV